MEEPKREMRKEIKRGEGSERQKNVREKKRT